MANLENLSDENVKGLQNFFDDKIKPENPEATLQFYSMQEKIKEHERAIDPVASELQRLTDAIVDLKNELKHIFDGHVIINGQFKKIKRFS